MYAALLQHLRGFNAFPRGGDLDQHAVNRYARGLIQLDNALAACEGGLGVKTQARINFSRHSARHDGQNFTAKTHQ